MREKIPEILVDNDMVVYLITNLINNRQYVGAEKRYNSGYFGSGRLIKEAIEKFGRENFKKKIIIGNIDSWEECLELESVCILSLNTLQPCGYNRKIHQWPPPIEAASRGGKKRIANLRKEGKFKELSSKGGKRTHELHPEEQKRWCRKASKSQSREAKVKGGEIGGLIAGKMRAEYWKENPEEHKELCKRGNKNQSKEAKSKGGKIAGKVIAERRESDSNYEKEYKASREKGGKKRTENLRMEGKLCDVCAEAGKMNAHILFEIDGLIQRTILGAIK